MGDAFQCRQGGLSRLHHVLDRFRGGHHFLDGGGTLLHRGVLIVNLLVQMTDQTCDPVDPACGLPHDAIQRFNLTGDRLDVSPDLLGRTRGLSNRGVRGRPDAVGVNHYTANVADDARQPRHKGIEMAPHPSDLVVPVDVEGHGQVGLPGGDVLHGCGDRLQRAQEKTRKGEHQYRKHRDADEADDCRPMAEFGECRADLLHADRHRQIPVCFLVVPPRHDPWHTVDRHQTHRCHLRCGGPVGGRGTVGVVGSARSRREVVVNELVAAVKVTNVRTQDHRRIGVHKDRTHVVVHDDRTGTAYRHRSYEFGVEPLYIDHRRSHPETLTVHDDGCSHKKHRVP